MIDILKAELFGDNAATYAPLTDAEVVILLNTENILTNKTSMTRQEVLEEIEPAALATLSGDNAVKVFGILSDTINPFGNAAQVFIDAFGAQSQTITNLAAARKHNISKAQELGIGRIREGHVQEARA